MNSVKRHGDKLEYKKYVERKKARNTAMNIASEHLGVDLLLDMKETGYLEPLIDAMVEYKHGLKYK